MSPHHAWGAGAVALVAFLVACQPQPLDVEGIVRAALEPPAPGPRGRLVRVGAASYALDGDPWGVVLHLECDNDRCPAPHGRHGVAGSTRRAMTGQPTAALLVAALDRRRPLATRPNGPLTVPPN